jgi:hypothetical protein
MDFINNYENAVASGHLPQWSEQDLITKEKLTSWAKFMVDNQKALQDWVFATRKRFINSVEEPVVKDEFDMWFNGTSLYQWLGGKWVMLSPQDVSNLALKNHTHDTLYQPVGDYSKNGHTHDNLYQPKGNYALLTHEHSNYVENNSKQVLDSTTPISVSNDTITLKFGDGSTKSVTTSDYNTNTWRPVTSSLTSTSTSYCLTASAGKKLNDTKQNKPITVVKDYAVNESNTYSVFYDAPNIPNYTREEYNEGWYRVQIAQSGGARYSALVYVKYSDNCYALYLSSTKLKVSFASGTSYYGGSYYGYTRIVFDTQSSSYYIDSIEYLGDIA